eukprot:UN12696
MTDIQMYSKSKELPDHRRLESMGITDDRNLISIMFAAQTGAGIGEKKEHEQEIAQNEAVNVNANNDETHANHDQAGNSTESHCNCDPNCENCESCENCSDPSGYIIMIARRVCVCWAIILCLIVIIHFIAEMHEYYTFVGDSIKFTSDSIVSEYSSDCSGFDTSSGI